MDPNSIQNLIESKMPDSSVTVTGDGRHFEARIISSIFEGMSLIQRQRYVNGIVGEHLRDGTIHALSIKTKTPLEWQHENK
jgi:acid stress-induced BolA-like protein IbaG/YrbA